MKFLHVVDEGKNTHYIRMNYMEHLRECHFDTTFEAGLKFSFPPTTGKYLSLDNNIFWTYDTEENIKQPIIIKV